MSESGYPGWKLSLGMVIALGGAIALSSDSAWAQSRIVPDSTLGAESSTVNLVDAATDEIQGGAIRGSNLFHSFLEFNVGEGRGVYFANPTGIENILSRVTGTSRSEILGKLGVLGNANLFLINPNGILFGPNASLDMRGSFLASTASSFKFADGTEFSTTNPQAPTLLTISVPIGLQFGGNTAQISVQGAGFDETGSALGSPLEVQTGKTFALVGGNVSVDGGIVFAPGGRVELGGVANSGTVGINVESNNLSLTFPDNVARADILLTNGTGITVAHEGGGSIAINAQNIDILGGSILSGGISSDLGSVGSQAGDITLNSTGAVRVGQFAGIGNQVFPQVTGDSGNIQLQARSLSLTGGAQIGTNTFGRGNAGNVSIDVRDTVTIDGVSDGFSSGIFSTVQSLAEGNGGNIDIKTGSLYMSNAGALTVSTLGKGNAGNIFISANGSISLTNISNIRSVVEPGGVGNGGNIEIYARRLSLTNGAQVLASVFRTVGNFPGGQGTGGNIRIYASDSVNLSGVSSVQLPLVNPFNPSEFLVTKGVSSGLFTNTERGAIGRGGDITVTTDTFRLANGAIVNAQTLNSSNGGNITINTQSFAAVNGGQVLTISRSSGQAGDISINATGNIILAGSDRTFADRLTQFGRDVVNNEGPTSGLFASTSEESTGTGGSLSATAGGRLTIREGARVSVNGEGLGEAGGIEIKARSINLDNQGSITATTHSGPGGNISLRSPLLTLRHNSSITTNAQGIDVPGGNITLNSDVLAALENSDISANSQDFRGGNITINAQGIFGTQFREALTPESDITATGANSSLSGTVQINTPDIDPSRGLVQLPHEPVNMQVAQGCQAGGESSVAFFDVGRGGLAPDPYEPLSSNNIWEDVPLSDTSASPITPPDKIVEAQGWLMNEKGQVVLVAEPSVTRSQGRCRLR